MLRKVLPILFLVVATAMAHAEKISGFVKGSPSGKMFVLGSKKGEFKVDASKASVRNNGKFFSISSLTGGSQVTVEGTVKGKMVMAKSVDVGHLAGSKKPTAKPAAPMAKPKPKPMAAPMAKPAPKTMSKVVVKPKSDKAKPTTKPTDASKKPKPKTKAGDKPKSKK